MNKQLKQMRKMWTPKRREMPEQCVSCPFRRDNDDEFKAVLDKLVVSHGCGEADVDAARFMIRKDVDTFGDFICHQSAYEQDMTLRPQSENRQCPGATRHHRGEDES